MSEPSVDLALAREHGLDDAEYERILEILGRTPSFPELGIFSVMWSDKAFSLYLFLDMASSRISKASSKRPICTSAKPRSVRTPGSDGMTLRARL